MKAQQTLNSQKQLRLESAIAQNMADVSGAPIVWLCVHSFEIALRIIITDQATASGSEHDAR